jgi:hypothetical protein
MKKLQIKRIHYHNKKKIKESDVQYKYQMESILV